MLDDDDDDEEMITPGPSTPKSVAGDERLEQQILGTFDINQGRSELKQSPFAGQPGTVDERRAPTAGTTSNDPRVDALESKVNTLIDAFNRLPQVLDTALAKVGAPPVGQVLAQQPATAAPAPVPSGGGADQFLALLTPTGNPTNDLFRLVLAAGRGLGILKGDQPTQQAAAAADPQQQADAFANSISTALNLVQQLETTVYERMRATTSMVRALTAEQEQMDKVARHGMVPPPGFASVLRGAEESMLPPPETLAAAVAKQKHPAASKPIVPKPAAPGVAPVPGPKPS